MFGEPIYRVGRKPKKSPYVAFEGEPYKTKGAAERLVNKLNNGRTQHEIDKGLEYKVFVANEWKEL